MIIDKMNKDEYHIIKATGLIITMQCFIGALLNISLGGIDRIMVELTIIGLLFFLPTIYIIYNREKLIKNYKGVKK